MHPTRQYTIFRCDGPTVSLKLSEGRILNGHFKLVHVIDLSAYETMVQVIDNNISKINKTSILKVQLEYQLSQVKKSIEHLVARTNKQKRSINWIGSAWKWIAGNPDATDWDTILDKENELISNNNKQFRINTEIMSVTNNIIGKYNSILAELNHKNMDKYEQMMFNKLSILKEALDELVLAVQLAKRGIVNTNLLDRNEIKRIVDEVEELPYSNDIDAVEYAEPGIFIKEWKLIYVLSIPKANNEKYDHVLVRPVTKNQRRIFLQYEEIFMGTSKLYGLRAGCERIKSATICKPEQVKEISCEHCMTHILQGSRKGCQIQITNDKSPPTEWLDEETIFLSDYKGTIKSNEGNNTQWVQGSFVIKLFNETITISGRPYTSTTTTSSHVIPTVLQTDDTDSGVIINSDYLHNIQQGNIQRLDSLNKSNTHIIYTGTGTIILAIIIVAILVFCKKRYPSLPTINVTAPGTVTAS